MYVRMCEQQYQQSYTVQMSGIAIEIFDEKYEQNVVSRTCLHAQEDFQTSIELLIITIDECAPVQRDQFQTCED